MNGYQECLDCGHKYDLPKTWECPHCGGKRIILMEMDEFPEREAEK